MAAWQAESCKRAVDRNKKAIRKLHVSVATATAPGPHHVLEGALQNTQLPKIRIRMVLPRPLMRHEDSIA